jgi:hypothetical protein
MGFVFLPVSERASERVRGMSICTVLYVIRGRDPF